MARRTVRLSLVGVACSSAGVLAFEIVLTRVFSVAQFYHFAFLTVSLALLGFGASGSILAAFPNFGRGGPRRWALLAFAQGLTTVGAFAVTNRIPFDSFAIAWDRRQVAYLIAYYLALAVPFFFGGAVIGALLSGWDQPVPLSSPRVYGASLVGSGIGCVVALGALPVVGGIGVVLVAAGLGIVAATAFSAVSATPRRTMPVLLIFVVIAIAVAVAGRSALELRLSPYKDLSSALRYPDATILSTSWESSARVDHVASDGIRSVPGLSFAWSGAPPTQDGITFDGDDLSPIPIIETADAEFAAHVLNSVAFSLRPGGDVLVLEPRGGLDVIVALAYARTVTAVEAHAPAIAASQNAGSPAYLDPRVEVVIDEPRSFVERTERRFDIVDIALTAPYRPVTSGAYSLAEDYMLTAEAFDGYLDVLQPDGVVALMRWLQTPPSETIRLIGLAVEAVGRSGADPARSIIALRGYATGLVLVKPAGFSPGEVESIAGFAATERFDIIVGPGIEPTNRYNILQSDDYAGLAARLLTAPGELYESYEFDITPPRDSRPFFTHFSKWSQAPEVLDTLGRTWQPFGGAGFFVLLALLALSALGAIILILGPLLIMRGATASGAGALRLWTVGYFGLLGLAFLLVELPLVQHYILLVGRPTTALAVVLFSLLLAAGAGSIASPRLAWRPVAVTLTLAAFAYPPLVRVITATLLPAPLPIRITAGALALIPLGFLMGVMFPKGLALLEATAPGLVPWAWGINGTTSVIAAVAAALLTLTWGSQFVVAIGAACYAAVALLAWRAKPIIRSG